MTDKRMLIIPAEIVAKIDDNRGDMGQAEFINFLIENQLKKESKAQANTNNYATKEEFYSLEQDTRKLLRSFLDFFVNYGLEMGKRSPSTEFEELTSKLEELEKGLALEDNEKRAKLKWK